MVSTEIRICFALIVSRTEKLIDLLITPKEQRTKPPNENIFSLACLWYQLWLVVASTYSKIDFNN